VFCNPPFHQKHALTDNIAWEMFHHARRCLKINGELYIVANRHHYGWLYFGEIQADRYINHLSEIFSIMSANNIGTPRPELGEYI
ncbi:methyltransferase, partial [Salmonella enterica subsp. enterica serovar Montevideo]|nr:methyltransferase [Salmonella enterica subsp. enterica serovar Montevideo]